MRTAKTESILHHTLDNCFVLFFSLFAFCTSTQKQLRSPLLITNTPRIILTLLGIVRFSLWDQLSGNSQTCKLYPAVTSPLNLKLSCYCYVSLEALQPEERYIMLTHEEGCSPASLRLRSRLHGPVKWLQCHLDLILLFGAAGCFLHCQLLGYRNQNGWITLQCHMSNGISYIYDKEKERLPMKA